MTNEVPLRHLELTSFLDPSPSIPKSQPKLPTEPKPLPPFLLLVTFFHQYHPLHHLFFHLNLALQIPHPRPRPSLLHPHHPWSRLSRTPTPSPPHPPQPSHPMITRAKAGIFKPRHLANYSHLQTDSLHIALHATHDPKSYLSAIKQSHWLTAMTKELQALHHNHTWSLVPRPPDRHVVGCKWIFRTKFLSDGSVDRYKARLVAQGYSQYPGIDYSHTFSPVVKATTVRIILSLAVLNKWKLHQLDVNNAFLHGRLDYYVLMGTTPWFS
ncbi:putative RNA-directed DNA polymerase [Helianthus annuus]|nr:putative RNA-directed DNA polymerase [Helianthus annuus]